MTAAVLPHAFRVVAVVAHPDDESFGLGAALSTFAEKGSSVGVVCLTRGEPSALGATEVDLACTRQQDFRHASTELGITAVAMLDYPDGLFEGASTPELIAAVDAHATAAELLVVFDTTGVTGHVDHRRATEAAVSWAGSNDVPVLAWTLPVDVAEALNDEFGTGFVGRRREAIDIGIRVSRTRQMVVICTGADAEPATIVSLPTAEVQRWHANSSTTTSRTPSPRSVTTGCGKTSG